MKQNNSISSRPLSPHLQIHKFMFGMMLSISHRLTGMWLALTTFVLVMMLFALSKSPLHFGLVTLWLEGWGQWFFLFSLFCFYYHLCNGVRHMIWDTGRGITMGHAKWSGLLVVLLTVVATYLTWYQLPGWMS